MAQNMEVPFFPDFRVLVEFDEKYKMFVAYCLNTGNVISADDSDTAVQMMKEVLEDEVFHAIKFENYSNLFSSTAPPEIFRKWHALAKKQVPRSINLNVRVEKVNLEPTARIELATAAA